MALRAEGDFPIVVIDSLCEAFFLAALRLGVEILNSAQGVCEVGSAFEGDAVEV